MIKSKKLLLEDIEESLVEFDYGELCMIAIVLNEMARKKHELRKLLKAMEVNQPFLENVDADLAFIKDRLDRLEAIK